MNPPISISDKTFHSAESLAKRMGISRRELYSRAVNAYGEVIKNQLVTEKLIELYGQQDVKLDEGLSWLQVQSLDNENWL